MVKINYAELKFDHIVEFKQEQTVFAAARENGSGKSRLFLAFGNGQGRVYTRNGIAESWEVLPDYEADCIRSIISRGRNSGEIAIYKFNGSSEGIAGQVN